MSTQRIIRRLPNLKSTALDDRPATVQWMLALWAVLVTVLVIALGGFDDTRLLYNGWFRLAGVAATWGLLAWAAATPGKWMAQRLRLAVAASLAFHTLLAIALVYAHLTFLLTQPEPDIDRQIVVEPIEVPKLVEVKQPVSQDEPVFEKPVPTDRLATQQQPQTTQAKASTTEPIEPTNQPPELASSQAPQSLAKRRPRTALTHRAKAPGQRSRQPDVATLATTLPESIERPKQIASASPTKPSPSTELAKASTASRVEQPREPDIDRTPAPATVAQRSNNDAPKVAQAQPTPRSRQSPAEVTEPALAQIAPSITTPETNRLAAEPTRLQRPKTPAAAPQDVPEPQQQRSVPPTGVARRDTRDAELPLAASPTPLDRRQPVSVAEAVALTPQTRQVAEVTRTESTTERMQEPVAASVSKRQVATNVPSEAVSDETLDNAKATPTAPPNRRRVSTLAVETPTPTARQRTVAEAAVSQTDVTPNPLVAAVPRAATLEQSTSPAPRVLADSRGGTAMRGDGLNSTGDAPAAPTYSAPFAATAARRNRSTQTERGPALAPNPVATVARSRAAAASPSSTLMALPVPNAQVAGSHTPQSVNASSSAAVERQFANVTLGDMTAARGESEFDTGPPQIAPERGTGRGAMGGRLAMRTPETNSGLGPRRLSQAAMSPSATELAAAAPSPSSASEAAAAIARNQPQSGGAAVASATGRPARTNLPKLSQSRAPAGAVSGGGATPPSVGPPPSATEVGASPPRAGGSITRTRNPAGRGTGPSIASSGVPGPSRSLGGAASSAATAVAAVDPVAVALVTPLSIDLARSSTTSPAPATASTADVAPKRRALMPAELGAGGIGSEPSLDAGVPQRIARRQTNTLRLTPSRFTNRTEGGKPAPPGRKRNPAPAFAARTDRTDSSPLTSPSDPSPKTEAAIELGLEFLAKLQQDDGRWSLGEFGGLPVDEEELPTMQADGAATGLALLAFLGGGYDHYDDKYQAVVQRGLDYLVVQQSDGGDIFPERDLPGPRATRFYSHGIAALALCEAYGMTGDPELRGPAQAALDYITRTQHRRLHGWRYTEGTNSDLSVTGWQMMALRSGELAGLRVGSSTYRRVREFVEQCRETAGGGALYCYNPYVNSTREGMKHYNKPGTVMTSVGMLMQLYLGENREARLMQRGADHLANNLPTQTGQYRVVAVGTPGNPQRDTYYWYYATQVMFHMGGDYWQQWHEHLHPLLVDHQTQEGPLAGSWNPQKPVPDMWGNHGGRIYVTCLNLLSLEVSYRHLPLYEMTGK